MKTSVELREVGPREGFQFEGRDDPTRITATHKAELVNKLADTGLRRIQVTSYVSPKVMPQMADADEVTEGIRLVPGVVYEALYLNDVGLKRAMASGKYEIDGRITLSASETFTMRNQHRNYDQDVEMQDKLQDVYRANDVRTRLGIVLAAFGCNFEGDVPHDRVLKLIEVLMKLAVDNGVGPYGIEEVSLADTMGWADPRSVSGLIGRVQHEWPGLTISLHLHDTRAMAMASLVAALDAGVRKFDTSIGGLGGCPFAGSVAGNLPTEDVAFMCDRLGVETGVNLQKLVESAHLAEQIVGHPLPSRLVRIS